MKVTLIKTDGTEQTIDLPSELDLPAKVEELIGSTRLDFVNFRDGRYMLLDDLGHQKSLPANPKATELYHTVCLPGTTHQILGDVVLVKEGHLWDVDAFSAKQQQTNDNALSEADSR